MRKRLLSVLLVAAPAAARLPSADALRRGCAFDGSPCSAPVAAVAVSGGETERFTQETLDGSSGLTGELLKKTREGEGRLLQKAIDESPALTRAFADVERTRAWRDYYDERVVDAAVASWGSNLKAGYLKGTAAAYATYRTAPPVVDVVAGGALWIAGAICGLGLGLLASVFTGHL